MLNLLPVISAIPAAKPPPASGGRPLPAPASGKPPATAPLLRLQNYNAVVALKDSQSNLSKLQSLNDLTLKIDNLLQAQRSGTGDKSSTQAQLKELTAQLHQLASDNSFSGSAPLDSALTNMEDALGSLGSGFADTVSPITTLGTNAAHDSVSASTPEDLSAALESVSKVRLEIDASAGDVYLSMLQNAAGNFGGAISDKLIGDIDTASGSVNFNIEQTILQAGNDVLRDRSTISALVTFLLQ